MRLSKTKKAVLALILANLIWGAAPPIFKWSLESTPLFTLGFIRFLFPVLLIPIFFRGSLAIKPKDFFKVFLMGLMLIPVNILFLFLGVKETLSLNAPIIGSAGPIFLMFGSLLFLKEKIKKRVLIGNMIGFIGILFIVLQPTVSKVNSDAVLGNFYIILSTLGVVLGTIFAKDIIKKYHPLTLTFWAFVIGTVSILPFFVHEVQTVGFLPVLNVQVIIGIIFGCIFSSLLAYFLFLWSLKYFPASEVGVFTYIDPVIGTIISMQLLQETITSIFLFSSFLVFFGIYIAEGRLHYHPFHRLFGKK